MFGHIKHEDSSKTIHVYEKNKAGKVIKDSCYLSVNGIPGRLVGCSKYPKGIDVNDMPNQNVAKPKIELEAEEKEAVKELDVEDKESEAEAEAEEEKETKKEAKQRARDAKQRVKDKRKSEAEAEEIK